jgi:hypothetical protein
MARLLLAGRLHRRAGSGANQPNGVQNEQVSKGDRGFGGGAVHAGARARH